MKEYLEKLLSKYKEQRSALKASLITAGTAEERQAIADSIEAIETEMLEAETQLRSLPTNEEGTPGNQNARSFNPLQTYGLNGNQVPGENGQRSDDDITGSMEYRTAFREYVRTGTMSECLVARSAAATGSGDLGIMIPITVDQTIQQEFEKVRGTLYTKVKKTNLKGGVKYPIGAFSATFKRITETTVSDRQKGGSITGFVEFGYVMGEIRLAKTLLESILSVEAFETELAKVIVQAYIDGMEKEILTGDPSKNECTGILYEAKKSGGRIPKANIIEFTEAEIQDWTSWEKKLFAEIPMAMEKENPEFVMAKQTYVSQLCTMKDTTGQPIKKAGFDVSDKLHKFNEYEVNRVEKDLFNDYALCANGDFFGMFWVPEKAYAINSNLEFYVMRYFDNETNQIVDKALVINDGKILDPKFIYLFKKKIAA